MPMMPVVFIRRLSKLVRRSAWLKRFIYKDIEGRLDELKASQAKKRKGQLGRKSQQGLCHPLGHDDLDWLDFYIDWSLEEIKCKQY